MRDIIAIGRHEGVLAGISRGVAYGDNECIEQMATICSAFVKPTSVIVPMPSHIGWATVMLKVALSIGAKVNCDVWDTLRCRPHESCHICKLQGVCPPAIEMTSVDRSVRHEVIIVDNLVGTGATASAAMSALDFCKDVKVLALTKK